MTNNRESPSVQYWRSVKATFKRYGIELREGEKPNEPMVHQLLKNWISKLGLTKIATYGVGAPDFVTYQSGLRVAIEAKGHSNEPHSLTKIMEQLKRYLQACQVALFVTHSYGLKAQLEGVLAVSDIGDRVIPLTVRELPRTKPELKRLLFDLPDQFG